MNSYGAGASFEFRHKLPSRKRNSGMNFKQLVDEGDFNSSADRADPAFKLETGPFGAPKTIFESMLEIFGLFRLVQNAADAEADIRKESEISRGAILKHSAYSAKATLCDSSINMASHCYFKNTYE